MNIICSLIISVSLLFFSTKQDSLKVKQDSLKIHQDSSLTDNSDSLKTKISVSASKITSVINEGLIYPKVENNAFKIGEKLIFKIRYGIIRAGTATMSVKSETTLNERPVYHIQTTAESATFFNYIYKVEDVIDSYMDKEGLFSWKFDKRLREGGYKADVFVNYFPEDSIADVSFTRYKKRMRRIVVSKKQNYKVKVPPFSFDVLAALYYARTQDLEVGKSIYLTNHDNKKVYKLEVRVYKKVELEVEAGTFRCLLVEPLLEGEGLFKRKGRLKVWLTDDHLKIPVQMRSEVVVGNITTELEEIKGINQKIPAMLSPNE